jgi:hypothetical protein
VPGSDDFLLKPQKKSALKNKNATPQMIRKVRNGVLPGTMNKASTNPSNIEISTMTMTVLFLRGLSHPT